MPTLLSKTSPVSMMGIVSGSRLARFRQLFACRWLVHSMSSIMGEGGFWGLSGTLLPYQGLQRGRCAEFPELSDDQDLLID
jgi:hypothetical protein